MEKQGSVDQGSLDVEPEVLIPSLQQVLHTDENVILADTAQEWRLVRKIHFSHARFVLHTNS